MCDRLSEELWREPETSACHRTLTLHIGTQRWNGRRAQRANARRHGVYPGPASAHHRKRNGIAERRHVVRRNRDDEPLEGITGPCGEDSQIEPDAAPGSDDRTVHHTSGPERSSEHGGTFNR